MGSEQGLEWDFHFECQVCVVLYATALLCRPPEGAGDGGSGRPSAGFFVNRSIKYFQALASGSSRLHREGSVFCIAAGVAE